MNLIEALKSGKPVTRSSIGHWLDYDKYAFFGLSKNDLLADDWEIQEEPKKRWVAWGSMSPFGFRLEYFRREDWKPDEKPDHSEVFLVRIPHLDAPADWEP